MSVSLKFIVPELVVSKNMAVVASSARLKDTNYGSQIDSFNEVIRFNRAPVVGYEDIVGKKTTHENG